MYYYIMYVLGRLRRKFLNQIPENKNQYKKSRVAFTIDGATSATIAALVANTYLSGFLQHIGVSTTTNGIINALASLAATIQPFGAAFAQRYKKRKPLVSAGAIIHRSLFTLMFFVPLFIKDVRARVVAVTIMFTMAHFIGAFITPAASNWLISLTPQRVRGKYYSIRELYSLIVVSAITLMAGMILDKTQGERQTGFVLLGVIVGILTVVNFISLAQVMEPESLEETTKGVRLWSVIKMVLGSKGFRPILIMHIIYSMGIQIAVPFNGIYLVDTVKLSYTLISIVGFAASILKALIVRKWGRLADRTSWANVCKLSIGILGTSHVLCIFLTPSTGRWVYPITAMLSNIGWAAIGIAILNVQYDYAPLKGRTMYIGVCAAATGLLGFSGVFIGSWILGMIERLGPMFFGEQIHGQQILMLLSGIILISCSIYISKVVEKGQKIINKEEGIPK
jgi:Na+/melibiose symporter-like transporter